MVGSINYVAVNARPDMSRATSKLSEYLKNPSKSQLKAAEHLLKYLVGTRYRAIQYDGLLTAPMKMSIVASDASFADNADRKSFYGYYFQLFGGAIHYKATKQKTVTTSSTEAELLGVTATVKELFLWKRFFSNVGFRLDQKPMVYCDNLQMIRLLTLDAFKLITKLKHVDIHNHWLRQEV